MARQPVLQLCGATNPPYLWYHDGVTVEDEADDWIDRAPGEGTGIVSGIVPATVTGSSMVVTYPSGEASLRGVRLPFAGGTVTVGAANTTDRRDLIVLRLSGGVLGLHYLAGTAWTPNFIATPPDGDNYTRNSIGYGPIKPSAFVSSTDVPLSEVLVPPGATFIANGFPSAVNQAELVDKAAVVSAAGGGYQIQNLGTSGSPLTAVFGNLYGLSGASATYTVDLPAALADEEGEWVEVKNIGDSGSIVITPNGSDEIDNLGTGVADTITTPQQSTRYVVAGAGLWWRTG
jgi:hypothetical protein